jgi:hypothetical protein
MVEINNNITRAQQLIEMNQQKRARAEEMMRKRAAIVGTPEVTNRMARSISDERREIMEMQLEAGEYREQGSQWVPNLNSDGFVDPQDRPIKMVQTQMGVVAGSGKGLYKMAAAATPTGNVMSSGSGWRGANNSGRQIPEVYSPLWLNSNLNLPRDRPTINAWARSFFALNPIVHNAITLHSTYPIAKLNIKCKNPKVEKFFGQMIEEIDLMNMAVLAAQEYWILGEAFIYGELDEAAGKWNRLMILNPDYVNVQRSVIAAEPIISLRPDENLRRVVHGNQQTDIQQRQQLDPSIIEHVRRNENIPLNNFYVHHMARRISPYEIRGTGLIVSCFRALMLWDKLRESKYAQADNMVNPLTVVKIGDNEFRPSPVDLEHFRNIFEEAQYDKDFKIFTHNAVNVDRVGYGQGIYDTSNDVQQLIKEIYIGLMVPSVIMDGSDTTYATGSVALDVLRQRYMQFRQMMTGWLKRKIFAPIAQIQDFYEYIDGEKTLIVPEVDWNHMSLFDMDSYINNMVNLSQGEGAQKRVSLQTLYRSLGLEYEEEQRKIRYEDIQDAIRNREIQALARYPLHELKSLGPGDEIEEVADEPVPGESPYEPAAEAAVPGQVPPGGAPPLGGAPPPLGGGGGGPKPGGAPPPAPIGGGGAPKPPGGGGAPAPAGGGAPPAPPTPP